MWNNLIRLSECGVALDPRARPRASTTGDHGSLAAAGVLGRTSRPAAGRDRPARLDASSARLNQKTLLELLDEHFHGGPGTAGRPLLPDLIGLEPCVADRFRPGQERGMELARRPEIAAAMPDHRDHVG